MEAQTAIETVLEPAPVLETVLETVLQTETVMKSAVISASETVLKPTSQIVPVSIHSTVDTLFNKVILNSSLLTTIHELKTNGFNNASIPLLVLSITNAYNSYTTSIRARKLTVDDMQVLLERVYNYLVEKYDLVAAPDRLAMYNLFDLSLKLCLARPNVKKEVNSCLKFFSCK
jgi:hypothetical protein